MTEPFSRMEIHFFRLSQAEFNGSAVPTLFADRRTDRAFGMVSDGELQFKFGWQSDLVTPTVLPVHGRLCSICVDLLMVVVDFEERRIRMRLELDYFFSDARLIGDFQYVGTEMEVLKVDVRSLAVADRYHLPEFFESLDIVGNSILAKCVNGDVVSLS